MKDITVIIPLLENQLDSDELINAVKSVDQCQEYYEGKLSILYVVPKQKETKYYTMFNTDNPIGQMYIENNTGKYDYCSQINFGVKHVDTEYFSILEYDDYYMKKWFNMFKNYYDTNEDVSVFLPINVLHNAKTNEREFVNDIIWSNGFANQIGYIDFECLQATASFNLTGGIFKTKDWLEYNPSISIAFNYDYLLRATSKKQKVFVIPKEGYHHELFNKGSLSEYYMNNITNDENIKLFEQTKKEYTVNNNNNISEEDED